MNDISRAFDAVIFDMDGVVTDTATVHAHAWKQLFDEILPVLGTPDAEPFDAESDYRRYVDGRTREDGVIAFLESRGITPEFEGEHSVTALAERKQGYFDAVLDAEGVKAFPDAVLALNRLRAAGVPLALVTSSRNSVRVLEAAGLGDVFGVQVTGQDAADLGLPGKPAPAMFLEAAARLDVAPQRMIVLEDAEAGVHAAVDGGFSLVIGVDRTGNGPQLQGAGAHLVVTELDLLTEEFLEQPLETEVLSAELPVDPWVLRFDGYDPATEGHREALCTVGNGYWATRGAAQEAEADGVHYPGTYLAGVYNRLVTHLADVEVEDESLVNAPNWLPLTFRVEDGQWFHPSSEQLIEYRQELHLRTGVLERMVRVRDDHGRTTRVTSRRFISHDDFHTAALETEFVAEDWSGTITVRSAIDGRVTNSNVDEYRLLADTHLVHRVQRELNKETVLLEVETTQSGISIAMAARTRVFDASENVLEPERRVVVSPGYVAHEFPLELAGGRPVRVEKVVVTSNSRDRAIASPLYSATTWIGRKADIPQLLEAHISDWANLWFDFAVDIDTDERRRLALNLNTFHVLQTVAAANLDLDAGIPARGLHGEGYRGHIFWDEAFIYPILTQRRPELSRALLAYRYRRLPEAIAAAAEAGHRGAMFPWQSGIDGREETPTQLYNLRNEQWMPDRSHHQRHVGLAIAYSVWKYFDHTDDVEYLLSQGLELLVQISRFFVSLAEYDAKDDRFDISGVMGPDEFHDAYPGAAEPGLRNNAYTNVLTSWVLGRTLDAIERIRPRRDHPVWGRIDLGPEEPEHWQHVRTRLRVPFHADGVISQFEGYEDLKEFDWEAYRERYGRIGRMDLILNAEGDSTNNYRLSKQGDVLMLLYLLSAQEVREVLAGMGYELAVGAIQKTVDFYTARSTHGSTLSNVVHSWVDARQDRVRSWHYLTETLYSDLHDIQGGTTREGIHLAAMAGSVDMLVRCYTGMEIRDNALWFAPMLPAELPRVRFRMNYRDQPLEVEVTETELHLRLDRSDAAPITVHVRDETTTLGPGDERVFAIPAPR